MAPYGMGRVRPRPYPKRDRGLRPKTTPIAIAEEELARLLLSHPNLVLLIPGSFRFTDPALFQVHWELIHDRWSKPQADYLHTLGAMLKKKISPEWLRRTIEDDREWDDPLRALWHNIDLVLETRSKYTTIPDAQPSKPVGIPVGK